MSSLILERRAALEQFSAAHLAALLPHGDLALGLYPFGSRTLGPLCIVANGEDTITTSAWHVEREQQDWTGERNVQVAFYDERGRMRLRPGALDALTLPRCAESDMLGWLARDLQGGLNATSHGLFGVQPGVEGELTTEAHVTPSGDVAEFRGALRAGAAGVPDVPLTCSLHPERGEVSGVSDQYGPLFTWNLRDRSIPTWYTRNIQRWRQDVRAQLGRPVPSSLNA